MLAQLQFQCVHATDKLLVHLLDQSGIPGETARIQIAHLIDQGLQLTPRFRTILHYAANPVEEIQPLVNLALRIGRVRTLLRRHGPARDASIPRVIAAKPVAIAAARATARVPY